MFLGESTDAVEHEHYALQIGIGQKTSFRVRSAKRWHTYRAVIIAPNQPHQFDGQNDWCHEAQKLCNQIISALLGTIDPSEEINRHIQEALKIIQELPIKKTSAKYIADNIHLSQSQFIYLFKKQMGIPVRRYLLWLRLLEAIKQIMNGDSLTMAAHSCGFADSAHLSRTFKRMFGLTPAGLFKNSQFVQVNSCLHEYYE